MFETFIWHKVHNVCLIYFYPKVLQVATNVSDNRNSLRIWCF